MTKYSFLDDYSEGCHPNILSALANTNLIQQTAYGHDEYTSKAKQLIKRDINAEQSEVYLVVGGTLANIIIMSSCLRPYEAVVSADTGHIVVRETGAIEATGHKIINVSNQQGKITVKQLEQVLTDHAHVPHMVKPKLVYLSNATELGTLYSKQELTAISEFCRENNLFLFLDGARLATALTAEKNDLSLQDIAQLTDLFSLGATKNGALIGEAIIINNPALAEDFAFNVKQRGGMLSKGRLLGIQFVELFKDNLYFELAEHANKMAKKLSAGLQSHGLQLEADTETNQIFAVLPDALITRLQEKFDFYVWSRKTADSSVVRLVTGWATPEEKVDEFIALL